MIGEVSSAAGQGFDDLVRKDEEVEGQLVDVEAFMVEEHVCSSAPPLVGLSGGVYGRAYGQGHVHVYGAGGESWERLTSRS